ncbi:MAG: HlyD family secretion protein [Defluviitaleaceae bacterium]|nr:HlyD family secretion protein [Defluviitaleaceae bacterium]
MNENKRSPVLNKKIRVAIIAPIVLLIFIFMSGAIYNFNKPTITAALPTRGHINHREVTSGIVRYAETAELYTELAGWVSKILAREGDSIATGQPIIEMDFRTSPTEVYEQIENLRTQIQTAIAEIAEQINGLSIERQSAAIELEKIDADINETLHQMAEHQNEIFRPTTVTHFDIQQGYDEIADALRYLNQTTALYEAGIATRQELTSAESALTNLETTQEQLHIQYQQSLHDWQTSHADSLRNLENQLEAHQRARRTRNLNTENILLREETMRREHANRLANYERRIAEYKRKLEGYEHTTILSPAEGIVTDLHVNQGQHISANQLLAGIGLIQYFVVEGEIPLSNNFVTAGDVARLRNAQGAMEGVVTQVIPQEHAKKVVIAIDTSTRAVTAGETFTITFEESGSDSVVLVPNSAIGRDGDGYFIKQVRRRRGILGQEFYTRRHSVIVGDSDDQYTAIIQGITFFEPIVAVSDRAFSIGQSIRIRNEDDFFAN